MVLLIGITSAVYPTETITPSVAPSPTMPQDGGLYIDPAGQWYSIAGDNAVEFFSMSYNQYYTTDTDHAEIQYEPLDLKPVVIPNVPVEEL